MNVDVVSANPLVITIVEYNCVFKPEQLCYKHDQVHGL